MENISTQSDVPVEKQSHVPLVMHLAVTLKDVQQILAQLETPAVNLSEAQALPSMHPYVNNRAALFEEALEQAGAAVAASLEALRNKALERLNSDEVEPHREKIREFRRKSVSGTFIGIPIEDYKQLVLDPDVVQAQHEETVAASKAAPPIKGLDMQLLARVVANIPKPAKLYVIVPPEPAAPVFTRPSEIAEASCIEDTYGLHRCIDINTLLKSTIQPTDNEAPTLEQLGIPASQVLELAGPAWQVGPLPQDLTDASRVVGDLVLADVPEPYRQEMATAIATSIEDSKFRLHPDHDEEAK